ncbi:hypothetical protein BaRGS_00013746 [Batillaria attramentaria]|uniref:Uncharacterized protein n=1 Tax=Batillaria attramentaria TaxID=370345 RepID=A0ABD0L743_9CAEN
MLLFDGRPLTTLGPCPKGQYELRGTVGHLRPNLFPLAASTASAQPLALSRMQLQAPCPVLSSALSTAKQLYLGREAASRFRCKSLLSFRGGRFLCVSALRFGERERIVAIVVRLVVEQKSSCLPSASLLG